MNLTETIKTTPLQGPKSVRVDEIRALTSGRAGHIIPVCYSPGLREDRWSRGQCTIRVEMSETVKTLMNAVNVTAFAHFVPFLAFERFTGLDSLNRSYNGEPERDGTTIPFFDTIGYSPFAAIFKTLGIHAPDGALVNSAVVEAYNAVVNHRRQARSKKLPLRDPKDVSLAPAFWRHANLAEIVPDFDAAMIDGEVTLDLETQKLPLKGIYRNASAEGQGPNNPAYYQAAGSEAMPQPDSPQALYVDVADAVPRIFAELGERGVQLSLSNIEAAKKTVAFAALRRKYSGLDDDAVIDLLMQGIRVPDAQLSQPMLLDRKTTIVGYSKRYATDGASLDQSVTTGETFVDLRWRTPAMNSGGIVLITLEIVPEQLFERQRDFFLANTDVERLPNATRDYLDPEKVDIVPNSHVDVLHSTPEGTFGYAPLNHMWHRKMPRIGGKFFRQSGDPFNEDRQRIWAVETLDPALTSDFYMVNALHHNVFADTLSDPFEITALGGSQIVGNTVFGKGLHESTGDYEAIAEQVDDERIDQEGEQEGE